MTKPARTDLSADYVRRVLDYDHKTGIFRWKVRADYDHRWNTQWVGKIAGTVAPTGYRYIQMGTLVPYPASRLAWLHFYGVWPEDKVDHENGVRDDNSIDNLRDANPSLNGANKAKQRNNRSGYVGVHFNAQNDKWRARVNRNKIAYDIGFYGSAEEAAHARAAFLKQLGDTQGPTNPERERYFHWRDR